MTVVPLIDELGRRYLRHHVYIHDAQLPDQIRLDTTHLGYPVLGQLIVVPLSRWWNIGSAAAIPSTGVANLAAIMAEPDLHTEWAGPRDPGGTAG